MTEHATVNELRVTKEEREALHFFPQVQGGEDHQRSDAAQAASERAGLGRAP